MIDTQHHEEWLAQYQRRERIRRRCIVALYLAAVVVGLGLAWSGWV